MHGIAIIMVAYRHYNVKTPSSCDRLWSLADMIGTSSVRTVVGIDALRASTVARVILALMLFVRG